MDELKFRAGGLRTRDGENIHKRRESSQQTSSSDGHLAKESEAEEEDRILHMSREERQRGMRNMLKKRVGALDTWRDRRKYPVCEGIDDIFPPRDVGR